MRPLCALLLFAAAVLAGDVVHLRNGGTLRGRVVSETDDGIVIDLGTGRMAVKRDQIRLIERGAREGEPRPVVTRRDEWFLVLHRDKVTGWRRLVHTERQGRVTVEERTVFFRPGGGDDTDVRRVETATRDGRPLEFLLMETYGSRMELVSGTFARGAWTVRVTRDGATRTQGLDLEDGWVLALPAWSRFLATAKPGETRKIRALDLRSLRPHEFLLQRDDDALPPAGDDARPCHAFRLTGDVRRARAFYRPGEGSVAVELNGTKLVARRTTRARVELARRAHAAPKPLGIEEALMFPFHQRPKELKAIFPRAGLSIEAPDAGWLPDATGAERGLVATFEKVSLFASFEIFAYATGDRDADACLEHALTRLRLTAEAIHERSAVRRFKVGAHEARTVRLAVRHRGEELRCHVTVVRASDRYVVLVGASPGRWWKWAEDDFDAFVESLDVVE